MTVEGGLVSVN